MKIVFIADAHLKGLDDNNQRALAEFIGGLKDVDTLVILGDLFDFWTGYSHVVYCQYVPVLNSLINLRRMGAGIIYVEGNHDFNIGPFFEVTLGAKRVRSGIETEVEGKKIYLSHGDEIDGGFWHLLWKRFLRSLPFMLLTRLAGASITWRVASRLSSTSRNYNKPAEKVEDRLKAFARHKIKRDCFAVILGHSHRAGVQREEIDGKKGFYVNPGSWMNDFSYAVYEAGKFRIEKYRPNKKEN